MTPGGFPGIEKRPEVCETSGRFDGRSLDFRFAGCECVRASAADADVVSVAASDGVVASAAEDAVAAAQAVNHIRAAAGKDEIVSLRAGQCAGAGDEICHSNARAGGWLEMIDIEQDRLVTDARGRDGVRGGNRCQRGEDG